MVATISPQVSGRFLSEEALVRLFANVGTSTFASEKPTLSTPLLEFACADGVADVVLFSVRRDLENNKDLAFIPPSWAYALKALPYRKQFDEVMFASWCGVTRRTARSILSSFEEHKFLKRAKTSGAWIKIKQPKPLVTSIYAIEAKLRDWKKALFQAVRYRSFANQSWVLLDYTYIEPAICNMDLFRSRNIGLASIDSNGNLTKHYVPIQENPRSQIYYWQANAMIGAALFA